MPETQYSPTPHIIAFIDALGFKSKVGGHPSREMNEYLELIERSRKVFDPMKVTTIGDAVIFAIECPGTENGQSIKPTDREDFLTKVYQICEAVAMVQAGLAFRNIWIRGSITYDFVHFNQTTIVGQGFYTAYNLERTVAKFPRVILDGRLADSAGVKAGKHLVKEVNSKCPYARCGVLYDYSKQRNIATAGVGIPSMPRDVPTFVDYLWINLNHTDLSETFKQIVINILKRLREDVQHYDKHRWTADYILNSATYLHADNVREVIGHLALLTDTH